MFPTCCSFVLLRDHTLHLVLIWGVFFCCYCIDLYMFFSFVSSFVSRDHIFDILGPYKMEAGFFLVLWDKTYKIITCKYFCLGTFTATSYTIYTVLPPHIGDSLYALTIQNYSKYIINNASLLLCT